MKNSLAFLLMMTTLLSCAGNTKRDLSKSSSMPIVGTWQLYSATIIEKGDTVITDYNKNLSFIKIINETHFAFLQHDMNKGKDSTVSYSSGGGSYSLNDSLYTEHLEYCSAREWEGHDFTFTLTLKNDTLIQSGIEKIESAGINRINIEKYRRVKK